MIDPDEARWRAALKKLDVETVRIKLAYGNTAPEPDASVRGIVDQPPLPTRGFVEPWLAEMDAAERKHRARIDCWTLAFAAVAAVSGLALLALSALVLFHP